MTVYCAILLSEACLLCLQINFKYDKQLIDKIKNILSGLIGLPLTRTTRAADIECLKFGAIYRTDNDGSVYNIGEFALHLSCPWRLTNDTQILVGSDDLYQQADETADYNEDFDYDVNANLRDVKLDKLIIENKLIVASVDADGFGGIEIYFGNKIKLTVFPVLSSKSDNEYWRIIDFRNEKSKHLESCSTGYAISD